MTLPNKVRRDARAILLHKNPAFRNKGTLETTYRYNNRGLLDKQTQAGRADTLFEVWVEDWSAAGSPTLDSLVIRAAGDS